MASGKVGAEVWLTVCVVIVTVGDEEVFLFLWVLGEVVDTLLGIGSGVKDEDVIFGFYGECVNSEVPEGGGEGFYGVRETYLWVVVGEVEEAFGV